MNQGHYDIYPTHRVTGYMALVWIGLHIYAVFFGARRATVEADARQWLAAARTRGVES